MARKTTRTDRRFKRVYPDSGTALSRDVMEFLNISWNTLKNRIRAGEIAAWIEGRFYRFDWADVKDYCRRKKSGTKA